MIAACDGAQSGRCGMVVGRTSGECGGAPETRPKGQVEGRHRVEEVFGG
jgi:hypothetical protein